MGDRMYMQVAIIH